MATKTRRVISTPRQKRLARVIIENAALDKPINAGKMLEKAGYDKTTAMATPRRVIESTGVQIELKALGFDADSAKHVVQEIMLDTDVDPSARLKATDQVFKVTGAYAPEKHASVIKFGQLDELPTDELLKLRQRNREQAD